MDECDYNPEIRSMIGNRLQFDMVAYCDADIKSVKSEKWKWNTSKQSDHFWFLKWNWIRLPLNNCSLLIPILIFLPKNFTEMFPKDWSFIFNKKKKILKKSNFHHFWPSCHLKQNFCRWISKEKFLQKLVVLSNVLRTFF